MENQIIIASPDGTFRAYIMRPKVLPAPAVVVLHEVFGVNAGIRPRLLLIPGAAPAACVYGISGRPSS